MKKIINGETLKSAAHWAPGNHTKPPETSSFSSGGILTVWKSRVRLNRDLCGAEQKVATFKNAREMP